MVQVLLTGKHLFSECSDRQSWKRYRTLVAQCRDIDSLCITPASVDSSRSDTDKDIRQRSTNLNHQGLEAEAAARGQQLQWEYERFADLARVFMNEQLRGYIQMVL